MSGIPGKLTVGPDGKLTGPAHITINDPWPMKLNAWPGITGTMRGNVLHTMAGYMDYTVDYFNGRDPKNPPKGSAHFAIGTIGRNDGRLHQLVPLGQGYLTAHAYAANHEFYGTETEDGGHEHTPISDAGLWAWAQLEEALSAFAGYPLQELAHFAGRGLGYHRQFPAWNLDSHTCPGATMTDMVRVNQRAEIVRRAHLIRLGGPLPSGIYHADGQTSMAQLAQRQGCDVADIWQATAVGMGLLDNSPFGFGDLQRKYLNAGKWDALMPSGMTSWLP